MTLGPFGRRVIFISVYGNDQNTLRVKRIMLAYSFKLYSNAVRAGELDLFLALFRRLYNYCIGTHRRYYRWYGKYLNYYDLSKHITKLKKRPAWAWLKKLPSQAIQDVLERIDKAFKQFFSNKKKHIKASPPSFKGVNKYNSFTLKQCGYKFLGGNKVRIGKRIYGFHNFRPMKGKVKQLTIKRDNLGSLWLFVVTDYERSEVGFSTGSAVGFDFGLKTFLVGSDGTTIDFPLFLKEMLDELRRLNRSLSRKKRGSNNRKKAKLRLGRLHQKIQNKRNDYQWKLARYLVKSYDVICLEDLNLKGMAKRFGHKLMDFGFYSFVQKLEYLAKVFGKVVKKVDRFFPSSKTCSHCGYINKELQLKDRKWICPHCGGHLNRDFNAAINILREGTSSLGLDGVRPVFSGIHCLTPEFPML